MSATPPIVLENGWLRLHNQEGARIPVFFEDENGNPRDMTQAIVAFITEHGARILLTNGLADNEKVLLIAPETFAAYLDTKFEFVVRDESVAETPVVWGGKVIVEGF